MVSLWAQFRANRGVKLVPIWDHCGIRSEKVWDNCGIRSGSIWDAKNDSMGHIDMFDVESNDSERIDPDPSWASPLSDGFPEVQGH